MSYESKILNGLSEQKRINVINNFSIQDGMVHISFPDKPFPHKQKPIFIKPAIDEKQVMEYLKTSNHTTIEILKCILVSISSTNTFPTQKRIADNIHKDNTTVCKSFSKLKKFNIVYKGEDGRYTLSELSNEIKDLINTVM